MASQRNRRSTSASNDGAAGAPPIEICFNAEKSRPSSDADGVVNLFGALRRAMAKTGYSDVKEFQKVGLTVRA